MNIYQNIEDTKCGGLYGKARFEFAQSDLSKRTDWTALSRQSHQKNERWFDEKIAKKAPNRDAKQRDFSQIWNL